MPILSDLNAFYYFCFYIACYVRMSNTVLNKSGESRHLVLFPILEDKLSALHLMRAMSAVGLPKMASVVLMCGLSVPFY